MLKLNIDNQPDDETCGPTCLKAIYDYYGSIISLNTIIKQAEFAPSGGTLSPLLANHAIKNNFEALIYINNLDLFDPSWFTHGSANNKFLIEKLEAQKQYKKSKRLLFAASAYQKYLQLGGQVRFETINAKLLKQYFNNNTPVLAGLSATYLYNCKRERFTPEGKSIYDDLQGTPCGHFVILCGYDEAHRHVMVADPHRTNPLYNDNYYKVGINRLINAIMLGVLTDDANLLVLTPKNGESCKL